MKNRTFFFALSAIGLTLGSVPLSGCSYWRSYQARGAYNAYQNALAAGDMDAARRALTTLVHVQEDVPDYWIELGKLQLQMGAYREAYDAFAHAHELDRTDATVLATMAQLALLSKEVDLANEQAQSLALVAPNNPVVTLVKAYVALKTGDVDKANADADALLAATPDEPFAKGLKAQVLLAKNQPDDAISLLEQQHQTVPDDRGTIHMLIAIYKSREDWGNLARLEADALRLDPKNSDFRLDGIEATLRAGNLAAAEQLTAPLLAPNSNPQHTQSALEDWAQYAPAKVPPDFLRAAQASSGPRRESFADYFNRVGKPQIAAALLGDSELPVTHQNARHNAILAEAFALQGRDTDAAKLFNLILDREPDQADALRGRILLETRTGASKQAVIDAQRLVTIKPGSGEGRVILARAYLAARNSSEVRRTLWQAFQDLPDDDRVVSALRSILVSTNDADGQRRLSDELADRRRASLKKDLI